MQFRLSCDPEGMSFSMPQSDEQESLLRRCLRDEKVRCSCGCVGDFAKLVGHPCSEKTAEGREGFFPAPIDEQGPLKSMQCQVCKRTARNPRQLLCRHLVCAAHTGSVSCEMCSANTTAPGPLDLPTRQLYSCVQGICSLCLKSFTFEEFEAHVQSYHNRPMVLKPRRTKAPAETDSGHCFLGHEMIIVTGFMKSLAMSTCAVCHRVVEGETVACPQCPERLCSGCSKSKYPVVLARHRASGHYCMRRHPLVKMTVTPHWYCEVLCNVCASTCKSHYFHCDLCLYDACEQCARSPQATAGQPWLSPA